LEPSKYNSQVPLVDSPNEVGVNARISSSLAPLTPGTVGLPVVEISIRPSGRTLMESMFSEPVLKPTLLPLKYMLKTPAVFSPREVASKRTISWGATDRPLSVTELLNVIRMVFSSKTENANVSGVTPTSEPSKNMLQV
jgi:hypothetical protein